MLGIREIAFFCFCISGQLVCHTVPSARAGRSVMVALRVLYSRELLAFHQADQSKTRGIANLSPVRFLGQTSD
jgi:hypothetical protein